MAAMFEDVIQYFIQNMTASIEEGDLYAAILVQNPETLITGSGSPGAGIPMELEPEPVPVEKPVANDDDDGGIGTGAIVGIVIACIAVPLIALFFYTQYKKNNGQGATTSVVGNKYDDLEAGTSTSQRMLTVSATKPDADSKLGFSYKVFGGKIVVTSVNETGIFADGSLKADMEIVSINGTNVTGMDRDAFKAVLSQLPEGDVAVGVKEIVETTIMRVSAVKPDSDSRMGFTYKVLGNGSVIVASVKEDGIFGDTELKEGGLVCV
jgi:hypothetical protein